MKRDYYYPSRLSDQPEWHFTYADVLAEKGAELGLAPADVAASVNDSRHLGYALGVWLVKVREFGPGTTGELKTLRFGTGNTPFELPEFVPPVPPAGLTAVLPGALARIFKFVQTIKSAPGYTEGIGLLMGIVGSEFPAPPPGGSAPRITVTAIPGDTHEIGRIRCIKAGHQFVLVESRRGGGGWEGLPLQPQSPYLDDRPLLVPGQAEIREYRARFWDNGHPNGDWCDVAKVTISP